MSLLNPLSALHSASSLLPRGASASPARAKDAASSPAASTAASTTGATDIGSTFLSLLVQELQNQDPTAPMDSTAMVGQMISLNQLSQLTGINGTLTGAFGSAASSTSPSATPHALTSTAAALRLLQGAATARQSAVSPAVTLPAT